MSLYPNTIYRISIKALIEQDDKVLLVKEDNWKWELPWSGLDHGENPQKWLEREIMEEMWLKTLSIESNPSYFLTWFENNKWKSNVVYKTTLENFEFTPSEECIEIWFYWKEEAIKLDLFPNVIKFFEIYK